MADTTIKKNQTAEIPTKNGKNYSYQYVDIAQIHEYLEQNNIKYYQYVEPFDGKDYIMTVPIINGEEQKPRRGVQIVDATLFGNDNPAQKQGSATTYARRYSLLMAFGLATEDDDGQALTTQKQTKNEITTREQAEQYKLQFGQYKGMTIKEVVETQKNYANWLYQNGDDTIKKCLNLMLDNTKVGV